MKVLVVGTGYVGLTTGVALAYLGHQVICLDIDETKVAMLREGRSPIYEPGLPELMTLAKENIRFTASYEDVDFKTCDIVFIAVGTPSLPDGSCDLSQVKAAAEAIGERLDEHFTVVVNKSTVPIGSVTGWEASYGRRTTAARAANPMEPMQSPPTPNFSARARPFLTRFTPNGS